MTLGYWRKTDSPALSELVCELRNLGPLKFLQLVNYPRQQFSCQMGIPGWQMNVKKGTGVVADIIDHKGYGFSIDWGEANTSFFFSLLGFPH